MASTASRLDICNMALGFVGTRTIASPNENTPEAIQCALYWDRARRAALRDYPYSFAQRRVRLAEKPLPEVYATDFTHAYALPDGCLKVHEVHGGHGLSLGSACGGPNSGSANSWGARPTAWQDVWRMESTGEELIILARQSLAVADCTFDEESVSRWDELFVMAMARRLAAFIAAPLLKNDRGRTQLLEQLYQIAVPRAEGQDASERGPHDGPHSSYMDSWLSARRAW